MRTKNLFLFFKISIIFIFTYVANADNADLKQIVDFEDELNIATPLQSSVTPLKSFFNTQAAATQSGEHAAKAEFFNKNFLNFIQEYYNKPEFTDTLTYDTTAICQFLQISSDFKLDAGATYVVLRLFHNKVKSCDLILHSATSSVIESLNECLGRHFETSTVDMYQEEIQIIRKNLEKIILSQLSDQFAQVQFLNTSQTAKQITEEVFKFIQHSVSNLQQKHESMKVKERLRQMIIRFLEMLLEKTIWDPQKPEEIWESFLSISLNLQKLAVSEIIDQMDDIDDLLWSLTHSFCRFFNSFGISVPIDIYEKIELDLKNNSVSFLEEPEQEAGIKTKKEHIYSALFKSKIKAYAFEKKGIIAQ